jgi:ribonuclease D
MSTPILVTEQDRFEALAQRAAATAEIAIDCEFHGERRYYPTLYLFQIVVEGHAVAVDPTVVDLTPIRGVLETSAVRKLVHAGREDLRLLSRATGATDIKNVFDTQVAAGFLGYGLTVGYAKLVKELLDVTIDKSSQYTDWSGKLTPAQIDYALNDVRYLPQAALCLREELVRRGRLAWATEASRSATLSALSGRDIRNLYRRIQGYSRLGEDQLGVLRELAIWRELVAESENCRPESVVNEAALRQLAYQPPERYGDLKNLRGLGIGAAERYWNGFAEAIARGRIEPEPLPRVRESDPRLEAISQLLGAVRRIVSIQHDIAGEILATSGELKSLAAWYLEGQSCAPSETGPLSGWRLDLIGTPLLDTLSGRVSVKVAQSSPSGLELVRTQSTVQSVAATSSPR